MLRAASEHRHRSERRRLARIGRHLIDRIVGHVGGVDDLDRHRLDDQRLLRHDEAVALLVRGLEGGDDLRALAVRHDERRVGAVVFDMRLAQHADLLRRDALLAHLRRAVPGQAVERRRQLRHDLVGEPRLDRLLAQGAQIGQAHAIGREHAGEGMDVDALHAERVGDQAGMLPAGAAEAAQRVFGDVVAALDRDLLDGVRHVLDGDLEEALGDRDRRAAVAGGAGDNIAELGEFAGDDVDIDRRIALRAEHAREEARLQLAEHDVAVGDGERPAAAVAGRTRIGARRFRPDAVARAVERADRAAAGGHGVDVHHRRAHAHARHHRLEAALVFAGVMRHVGRGAAHVEADDLVEPAHLRRAHRADDAAGRARQDRILALEAPRIGKAAIRLHEQQPRPAELAGDAVDIAAQDGREIGVDDGGVAAAHQLHQRAHLMARRPCRKTIAAARMPAS